MQTIFLERSVALIPDAASLMIRGAWAGPLGMLIERIRAGGLGPPPFDQHQGDHSKVRVE